MCLYRVPSIFLEKNLLYTIAYMLVSMNHLLLGDDMCVFDLNISGLQRFLSIFVTLMLNMKQFLTFKRQLYFPPPKNINILQQECDSKRCTLRIL